jgi:tetratricopeptide (TPR) repeat protein
MRAATSTSAPRGRLPAYDAFISYSHAKDKPIAAALQSVVQRLGKPWYRRRALRVFRDDTSLSATPQLWPSIEQALAQSRFLILLASPEAAASPWVGKEVEYWLANKSPETLLIALTDGPLDWDHAKGDFAWSEATPLPGVLRGKFASEPRWVDLGAYRDGANPRDARFMDLGADFAAAVHGTPKEDLLSQEVRQQRRALTLAWSAAGTLFVLGGLAVWQWQVASVERQRAVDALGAARKTAETLVFDIARELRNRPGMPVDLVNDILERVQTLQRQLGSAGSTVELLRLEAVSLTELSDSYQRQGNSAAALQAAQRAVAILETIAKQHPDQRLLERSLAVALNQLGDVERGLEPWPVVLALYTRALAIVERLTAADPGNSMLLQDLWTTSLKIAEVETITGAYDAALANYRKGLAALGGLAAKRPDDLALQSDMAISHSRIGITLNAMKRYDEALAEHRAALAIRERIAAAQPNNTSRQREVAVSLTRVGEVLAALGQRGEAVDSFRKAIAIVGPLVTGDPGNAQWQGDLIGLYDALGRLFVAQGDTAQALDAYQRALEARERRGAAAPDNRAWQADLAAHLRVLGRALLSAGRSDDGISAYRRSVEMLTRLLVAQPGDAATAAQLAQVHLDIGDQLAARGQWAEAKQAYEQGRDLREKLAARHPADVALQQDLAAAIERLAVAADQLNDLAGALASYRAALDIRQRVMVAEPANVTRKRDYVLVLSLASDVMLRMGEREEGQQSLLHAFAIVAQYAADSPDNPVLQSDLAIGLYLLALHLDDDPSPRQERAREIVRKLEAEGRLLPATKAYIAQLEQKIAAKKK